MLSGLRAGINNVFINRNALFISEGKQMQQLSAINFAVVTQFS